MTTTIGPIGTHHVWTSEQDDLFTSKSDTDIAKAIGISRARVVYRRKALGLQPGAPALTACAAGKFTPEIIEELSTSTDRAIAAKLGVCDRTVARHRAKIGVDSTSKLPQHPQGLIDNLGKEPDAVLAKRFGVSHQQVKRLRDKQNIPRFNRLDPTRFCPELVAMLGKVSDASLARKYGMTESDVRRYRLSLAVNACAPSKAKTGERE